MIKSFKDLVGNKGSSEKLSQREQEISQFDKVSDGWNLEQIQEYLRGNNSNQKLSDIGMASILNRFISRRKDEKKMPSGQRREFESIDRPERTKKGFDIVIFMANQSMLSTDTIPLIEAFIVTYSDVIKDLDQKLSQTYEYKMKEAHKAAEVNALAKSQFKRSLSMQYKK